MSNSAAPVNVLLLACAATGCLSWLIFVLFQPPLAARRAYWTPITLAVLVPGFVIFYLTAHYAPFYPFTTGLLITLSFVFLATGLYLFGRRLRSRNGCVKELDWPMRLFLSVFVGALFFQSLVKLVNAGDESAPPRLVPGVIIKMYRTQGKGGADYMMFGGAASTFSNTNTGGLFTVDGDDYFAHNVGDHLCLLVHTGRLNLSWWELTNCKSSG